MRKSVRSISTYQEQSPQKQQCQASPSKCEIDNYYSATNSEQIDNLEKKLINELKSTMFNSPAKTQMKNRMRQGPSLHLEPSEIQIQKQNSSSKKDKLMSCAEGIFQGRLNDLNMYNQDYFDHIAGKCVCARCTCGKHKCNQQRLIQDAKGQPNSLYQDTYNEKDLSKAKPVGSICPCDNISISKDLKFENHTTHRDHYTPKKGDRNPSVQKQEDNIKLPFMPNESTTTYRNEHCNKGFIPSMKFVPVSSLGVVRGAPFKGTTENKQQYNPDKLSMYTPTDKLINNSKGVNMGIDQSKLPNFYQSTYQQYYSPMKGSPNERSFGNDIKKMLQGPQKNDGLSFIHNTTHRDHYKNRFNKLCPITIENYERTYQKKFSYNTDYDKANMSML